MKSNFYMKKQWRRIELNPQIHEMLKPISKFEKLAIKIYGKICQTWKGFLIICSKILKTSWLNNESVGSSVGFLEFVELTGNSL